MLKYDIFISYCREDKERVSHLVELIVDAGFIVFWDELIKPGENWRKSVEQGLLLSKSVLVIWTNHSVKSSHVIDEASRAGVLIPAKFDDVDIPLGFGSIHTQDLVEWDRTNTSKTYLELIDALSNSSKHQGSELNSTTTVTEMVSLELKGPLTWSNGMVPLS